jgi:hypothetical protein
MNNEEQPTSRNHLEIWIIYDNPSDYPGCTVARCWRITAGKNEPTGKFIKAPLECLRATLELRGLYCIPRQPGDDPVIVESWL